MRKTLIALILGFVTVCGVFAQNTPKSIDELNGYDWVTWTFEHRLSFIQGYYAACTMLMSMLYEVNQQRMTEEQLNALRIQLENQFYYPDSVSELGEKLDTYYASPTNRKYAIYRAIPFLAGKEWWNRKTGVVDPPSATGNN